MRKDELRKELDNILSNKKIKDAVVIVLILAFVLIVVSFFTDTPKEKQEETLTQTVAQKTSEELENIEIEKKDYEENQKNELKIILEKMAGVGKVEVLMHFKSGEVNVLAVDNSNQVSLTEETDSNGGKRISNQETDGSKVVMKTLDGDNEPVILQTNKPTITGIVVVAEGAGNSKTKYEIQTAISGLYDIPLDKVKVYPMVS